MSPHQWKERRNPVAVDYEAAYQVFALPMIEAFNADGEFMPFMACIALDQASPGNVEDIYPIPAEAALGLFRDESRTRLVKPLVKGLLMNDIAIRRMLGVPNELRVDMVVQINEAWTIHRTLHTGENLNELEPSKCANRKEAMVVLVHGADFTAAGRCPIHDTPKRHCEYAPMQHDGELFGNMIIQEYSRATAH